MKFDSILVTGSSGTIGTALVEELLSRGYDVTGVDQRANPWSDEVDKRTVVTDLRDESALSVLPDTVDVVVHLAANARVYDLVEDPTQAKGNLDTTFHIAEYARRVGAALVFSSSREVYGDTDRSIYEERHTHADTCESPYAASKIGGEALVKSFEECYDMETCIVRFSNVYGKYDASNRVIPLFIAQAYDGQDLTVYGANKMLDFTYIDDCIHGITRILEQFNKASGETFNIASGSGTSLVEVARAISECVEQDIDIHVEANRTGEVSRSVVDTTKAAKFLGYDPEYSITDGLDATIDWYLSHTELFDTIRS